MISDMKIAKNVEYNERNVILTISELERGEGGGGGGEGKGHCGLTL